MQFNVGFKMDMFHKISHKYVSLNLTLGIISMPRPYQPDALESAILLILLAQEKSKELSKEMTRFRLAEISLKRLWGRHRLEDDFLREVQEWLFRAGWTLFYA